MLLTHPLQNRPAFAQFRNAPFPQYELSRQLFDTAPSATGALAMTPNNEAGIQLNRRKRDDDDDEEEEEEEEEEERNQGGSQRGK